MILAYLDLNASHKFTRSDYWARW